MSGDHRLSVERHTVTLVLDGHVTEIDDHPAAAAGQRPSQAQAPRPGRWRLAVSSMIVTALVVAFVVLQVSARPVSADRPPAPADPGLAPEAALLADLDAALMAWGDFAVSGDLAMVAPWFAAAGPQYRRLVDEAPALAASPIGAPGYVMIATSSAVAGTGDSRMVTAEVSMTRPGEASQRFQWQIEMRLEAPEDRWQVWTVKSVAQVATPV